jgi:outer membrane biosynthesis protein TonB
MVLTHWASSLTRTRQGSLLILGAVLSLLSAALPGSTQTIKTTGERKVISRVAVVYPKLALEMRLEGIVKLSATVAPNGKVVKTLLIGGSPIFVPNALNAVSLMKFEAAAKETEEIIEIHFFPSQRE